MSWNCISGRASWLEEVPAGATVRDLLVQLRSSQPRLAAAAYDRGAAELTAVVNLVLNDRLLELVGGLDAVLAEGDRLTLIPAYAGGGQCGSAGAPQDGPSSSRPG